MNEVLNVNRRKSRINELDIKQIKLSKYSVFQNFSKMRMQNKPRDFATRKALLEKLQNEETATSNLQKSIIKQNSKSTNILAKINNSNSTLCEDADNSNKRKSCNVYFDLCEISEKITTV